MKYPTLEEINKADRVQLARWYRFLPSPGWNHAGSDNFEEMAKHERELQDIMIKRFRELGGMEPWISKLIGW